MPEDRLVIRADADARMGIGHAMRMIALGQAWAERGGAVRFLGRIEAEPLRSRIAVEGFDLVELGAVHPALADLRELLALTDGQDWLALDGYHFDTAYLHAVRAAGRKTLVLDDLNDRGEYEVDVLLNQNLGAGDLPYRVNPEARLLFGPRYALLRREFRAARQADKPCPERVRNVLVTMGGSDPVNFSAVVLQALALLGGQDLAVRLVVGPANPNRAGLERLAAALPVPTELVTPGEDMPRQMLWADLAVTAAGSTCWELCYFGVPILAFELAENQAGVLAGLAAAGAAVSGGRVAEATPEGIAALLDGLLGTPARRAALATQARGLVDGQGAFRVAAALRPAKLTLRPARQDDADFLWRLANDPDVRAVSFTPEPIPLATHVAWLAARLADPVGLFFVAVGEGGESVGQIRLDEDNGCGVVSVSLAAPFRHGGIGTEMIRRACRAWAAAHSGQKAVAYVRQGNAASEQAFLRAGFVRCGEMQMKGQRAACFQWLPEETQCAR